MTANPYEQYDPIFVTHVSRRLKNKLFSLGERIRHDLNFSCSPNVLGFKNIFLPSLLCYFHFFYFLSQFDIYLKLIFMYFKFQFMLIYLTFLYTIYSMYNIFHSNLKCAIQSILRNAHHDTKHFH